VYPFIVVSIGLVVANLIGLAQHHRGTVLTYALLVLGICEIGLGIALLIWLKRYAKRSGNAH
jgi:NADH:ubiquinone oxidoreductase subunit K